MHGEPHAAVEKEIQRRKSRRSETLMCHDSLTELGHAYRKQSLNAKHHPTKPPKKPLTARELRYMSAIEAQDGGTMS